MSKKHKNGEFGVGNQHGALSHEAEYRIIKGDLIRVILLNAVYFIAVLTLYFTNKNTHYLENWFSKFLNF